MRAGEDTRPYPDAGTVPFSSQGPVPDRPARIRTGSVGSSKPGAEIEPHQRQFLHTQGPVARREFRPITQILRAENFAELFRRASPVTGDRGSGEYGHVSAHPEPSPGDPLVSFSSLGKKLAARRRRNLPARNETALSSPPHPSGLTASHLPPRGKALCGGAALIRPRGKAYNGRRRNAVSHKILLLTFLLRKVSQWSSLPPEFSHPAPAAPWTSGPPLSAWSAHPQCCGF